MTIIGLLNERRNERRKMAQNNPYMLERFIVKSKGKLKMCNVIKN
jgi:hypothetical protein